MSTLSASVAQALYCTAKMYRYNLAVHELRQFLTKGSLKRGLIILIGAFLLACFMEHERAI